MGTWIEFTMEIQCKQENHVRKELLNSTRARLVINKEHKYFSLPDHQLAENLILADWFPRKNNKG